MPLIASCDITFRCDKNSVVLTNQVPNAAAASSSQDVGSAWVDTPSLTAVEANPLRTSPAGIPSGACCLAETGENRALKLCR